MERFATNKNGNIDSGTEVLANNITFLQQAKELAISNLFGDLFVEGILNTGEASTMFELTSNGDGTFSVSQGVAYKQNVAVEPMIYERISIEDANEEYNPANPSQTTFDGVDQNIPTPKSTGCKNITIPNDGVLYYVDLRYLCVCDNGNDGSGLGLNNYSIAKNQITTSTDQRKRFYKWVDGYEIVLVETTGDIQGICLGTVEKNGVDVDITNDGRAKKLLIESRVIMDYFTSGKGIIVETNQETNQTQLTINVDDITTEIDDNNKVRVTKDGLYPYTKFAINSGPITFVTAQGNMISLAIGTGLEPLWVNPAYNDRYAITSNDAIVAINAQTEIQTKFSGAAGFYTVCINNTDKDNENAPLNVPILEIMGNVSGGIDFSGITTKYSIFLDLKSAPYKAKWYDGSTWREYHGVPIGIIQVSVGGAIVSQGFRQFEFNRDYSQWGEVGKLMPYVGGTLPPKYVLCDGSSYSPLLYNDLYRKIGTKFDGEEGISFAVPDFTNRVIWGGDSIDTFSYIAAGLPNIKGTLVGGDYNNSISSGAFSRSNYGNGNGGEGSDNLYTFNANNGAVQSGIYKDDCYTVQPPAVKIPILIRYTI